MPDKPTIGSVAGEISGIMSGIFADAQSALRVGVRQDLSLFALQQQAMLYEEALKRILDKSARAENVWREYMEDT